MNAGERRATSAIARDLPDFPITRISRDRNGRITRAPRTLASMARLFVIALVVCGAARAVIADPDDGTSTTSTDPDAGKPIARTPDAPVGKIFHGPFQSSRLYTMPSADTVGPYVLSIS